MREGPAGGAPGLPPVPKKRDGGGGEKYSFLFISAML